MSSYPRLVACFLGLLLVVVPAGGVVCLADSRTDPAVYATGEKVEVEVLAPAPGTAFTSNVFLFSTSPPRFIGTNRDVGTVADLGEFPNGTELVFGISLGGSYTYVTGPGERNPDGIVHAIVEANSRGGVTVRFEDLFAGGDFSFNDAVIRVTGVAIAP